MPLKLIPPGRRRGNPFYLARGRIRGKLYEYSTETADKAVAEVRLTELAADILKGDPDPEPADEQPVADQPKTFALAVIAYRNFANPSNREIQNLDRLIDVLGPRLCADLTQDDLVAAARQIYPGAKASSLNRSAITPASYVLHYAAANKWCPEWRIKRFREDPPETKALRNPDVDTLKEAAWHHCISPVTVMLDVLFGQGPRITEALGLTWERLDLSREMWLAWDSKGKKWRWKALDQDVAASLDCLPGPRVGQVFPWRNRWAFYKALQPALDASGVKFTPHMARHTLGFRLGKASLKTRMDILGHVDPKSSMRYDMSQIEEQRAALQNVGGESIPTKKAL